MDNTKETTLKDVSNFMNLFSLISLICVVVFFNLLVNSKETILKETSPNEEFSIKIKSGTYPVGEGIAIYIKNHNNQIPTFKKLDTLNILSADSSEVSWEDDEVHINVYGREEMLYIGLNLEESIDDIKIISNLQNY